MSTDILKLHDELQTSNDPEKQLDYAYHLYLGIDIEQDFTEAFYWAQKAAEQGNARAINMVGSMYAYGDGVKQDFNEGKRLYRLAASKGFYKAYINLGVCYLEEGPDYNPKETIKLYKKALKTKTYEALPQLGLLYEQGIGFKKSLRKAYRCYKIGYDKGCYLGAFCLARWYEEGLYVKKDEKKALEYYKYAAEIGPGIAAYKVATMYEKGIGSEFDRQTAFKYYQIAANKHEPKSFLKLAKCYGFGKGTEVDYDKAIKYFKKAAEKGEDIAHYFVGEMLYDKGDFEGAIAYAEKAISLNSSYGFYLYARLIYLGAAGKPIDYKKGFLMLQRSTELGNLTAKAFLSRAIFEGVGVEKNEQKAYQVALDAAKAPHNIIANTVLADCYISGRVTKKDEEKGAKIYIDICEGMKERVLDDTDQDIFFRTGNLFEEGIGVKQDIEKAKYYYSRAAHDGHKKSIARLKALNK